MIRTKQERLKIAQERLDSSLRDALGFAHTSETGREVEGLGVVLPPGEDDTPRKPHARRWIKATWPDEEE